MPDKYANFAALKAAESPRSYNRVVCDRATKVVVVAPHAGAIEHGTSEIALAIAGQDFSYYLFEGCKRGRNGALHITSSNFDEPEGLALMRAALCVVTIHGEKSKAQAVFVGGRDTTLKAAIEGALKNGGYVVREHRNRYLQGLDKNNICNRGKAGAGVQLELSRGLRASFFESLSRKGRKAPNARLAEFSALVRSALRTAVR